MERENKCESSSIVSHLANDMELHKEKSNHFSLVKQNIHIM